MENNLKIFKNEQFGEIRTILINGQPWFVGKDVAEILKYSNPRKAIMDHVDVEDKGVTKCDTLGGQQEFNTINESGLYSLILGSKLPTAKKFKHWVTSEVLPQIRQTGGYIPSSENDTEEDIMAKAFIIAKKKLELKNKVIADKERQLTEQKPKVEFADHVSTSVNSKLVREVAKIVSKDGIKIGERKLYNKLREWGWIFKNSCEATQYAIDRDYMEISESVRETNKGNFTFKTSRVTGKGQLAIVKKLKA